MLEDLIKQAAAPAIQLLASGLDTIAMQYSQLAALDKRIADDIEALKQLIS